MTWLLEALVEPIAGAFGYHIGRGKPWWVECLASLGCLLSLLLIAGVLIWIVR
jgi:hypothetical protein